MGIDDVLDRKWQDAVLTARSGHEWRGVVLPTNAPVRLLAAVREPDDRIALLIETALLFAPATTVRFETQGLSLVDQRRQVENVFRLAVTLERNELREVFKSLCLDLIAVASEATTPDAAVSAVSKRLDAWRVCLRTRKSGLTLEEQVGLLGELELLQILGKNRNYILAVEGWRGPLDGVHDFTSSGYAIEVKSVLGLGAHIHVSNLHQFETDGLSGLIIARPRFRLDREGKCLVDTVNVLRSEVSVESPSALALLDERLLMAGYLENDRSVYEAHRFVQESVCYYVVGDGFPKISQSMVPLGIIDGSYVIDERAIAAFRLDDQCFLEILNRNFWCQP